ncbi:Protein bark beetle [Lepeophtheirus salmonis]|uniref:Protein bark beetle n=1 Tax=Lepeophtheirus salmonis TaxID=72036 RepID=A0A7R8D4D3_LEPSM|nr:Protein bark beetle [Lepeophtheirus salmonis]CAF3025004.1 Protein bark beetle [Lepeophtheirus salmonis]
MMMIHSGKFPIVIIVLLTFISPLESGLITKTRIDQDEIWALEESPFIVQKDVLITAKLEIEPGVNVRFKPEAGLTIRGDGVLVAEGYESRLIKFLPDEYIVESSPDFNRTARLVDGPTINEGIVQVLEKGKWRSVCTNSRNWTQIDLEVTCRQLGFQGGCTGLEPRLDLCNWSRRRMGSGVCDHHPNLGIRCLPFHHKENRLASGHWRGLRFESAQFIKELTIENTLYVSSSRSILKFVEIIGAGRGTWRGRPNATSAVESWGIPPRMEHIHIRHCAYNGINITNPEGRFIIKNANITLNRGYGVFVNSSTGDINILDSVVSNNMGDGIKYYMHDKIPDPKVESGVDIHDFCTYSTTYSQTYPFMMVAEQYYNSAVNRVCGKRFYTQHGFLITLHFVHMISEENEGAILEIYDGSDTNSRLIVSVNVRNYTRPESAVSTGNNMYILFKADRKMKAEVFLEITAGPHRAFDLNVTNSNVAHNSGRGIWVQKMRSAVHLHKTQVWGHNHVAGLNVEYGSGDINVTESKISQNWVDGINITYAGGTQNISRSKLHNNLGHGFAVWFNETSVNYPIRQETIIQYSSITLNKDVGVLVGNYCGPALVNISGNHFTDGQSIALQILSCWKEEKNELINTRTPTLRLQIGLNPRSRVAAPVVLSSKNVLVFRNLIDNPESRYEIGSHLVEPNSALDCRKNWLGHKDEQTVWRKIFDRDDRYNLAKIDYVPYLLSNNINTELVLERPEWEPQFINSETKEVGGDVTGVEELRSDGVYIFETSVGMMIAGELIAEGDLQGGQPLLTLSEKQPIKLLDNSSDYVVRLVGGSTTHEGRLEIKIDDVWGTVCNFGWTIESAAIACQQIGGVLNPEDWLILPGQLPDYEEGPIHLSNVRCGPLDTDIRYCLNSESTSDFYGSCNHNNDVGIKCFGPSWSGIRLGMTAKRSKLYDVRIEKAGLFDYRIYKFVPAIQVDFSHHVFEHLDVSNNDNDGFGLSYSDIYYPDKVNFIKNCKFNFNKRHGLSFKQLGMRVVDTEILGNSESGIHHDPKLDKLEQRELREWMSLIDEGTSDTIISIPNNDAGTSEDNPIIIKEKEPRLIVSSEVRFNVSRDIASFPQISSSYSITLEYNTGKAALGNLMLLLTPIHCANLPSNCNSRSHHINPIHRSKIVPGSFPRYLKNRRGLSTIHYNRYLGHDNQVYLRKSNESIEIYDSEISSNREEAFYVFTPFRELNQFNISETTYMINRTKFFDNGRGIFQYSKDLRDSNNLYHWVLRENIFENNVGGGFDVALPYVWQYNENYTHTVHIDSNIIRKNQGFDIHIRGHFARVYVVNNTIVENVCHQGILALRGMEKEARIFGNVIQNNDGVYMVEFDTDSHSSINGFVSGYFSQNIVQRNTNSEERFNRSSYYFHPASYAIAVKGVQRVNLTDNLLGNPGLDYELLSGLRTARASNHLNAQKNYWGSSDERIIQQSIFDFDDWNSFAVTNYLPYYEQNDFDSLLSGSYRENEKDVSKILDNLGGRLWQSLRLVKRGRPYVVKSDLTIMPEVTLTIDPGVQIEFYPSVGILVLGTLQARGGSIDDKIIFKPARNNEVKDIRVKPQMPLRNKRKTKHYYKLNDKNKFEVRLCQANENGTICPPHINQGFVELFNQTTKQWVPICDKRFSERNAQVVCRQLGFSDINVHLDFGKRIEYHINSLTRIIVWPEPYQCMGKEPSLAQCDIRMNGQIYGHTYGCDWKGSDFAFIHCGEENLPDHYDHWGGIRFSVKEFEQELFHTRVHDAVTHSTLHYHESILEYIEIIGAGILHGEKSPAIQAVMSSPHITQIVIKNSAHDGINLISPSRTLTMLHNLIENNLGIGISAAVLSGEVREAELSAFIPLKEVPIPYHVFGLVDICDPQKEIVIEERILLYYKYDNNPVDCVKIFSSIFDVKPLGFRLLQFNLVDSQGESWTPDHLALYDGDLNHPMSIKFHATGARENMGFVAEVVTLPVSAIGIDRNILHNVSFSVFDGNQKGAIDYTSAGEINPIVTIQRNRFINNGLSLYGNFSTCKYGSVNLDVQNTRDMFFYNNYVSGNVGGFRLKSGSSGTATAMRGLLHNNVFADNVKKTTLALEGRQTSPYQQITLIKNYFTRSDVPYETAILFDQVVCNATFNTIHNNRGKSIMEVKGFSNVRLPIYQSFTHNGFFNNEAYGDHCDKTTLQTCTYGIRATVVAGSPGQQYVDNIFYNRNNDYELVTLNRSEWDVWKTPINAKYNYWAYNETYAVAGRIKDLNDEDGLLEVDFTPFQMNNKTLLSGIKCYPGWTLIDNTCFMYFGGPMTYKEAEEFCLKDNSSVPYQDDWRYYDMVWVKHLDSGIGECTVYVNGDVESADCDLLLPTLCENDPHPEPLTPFTSFLTQEVVYFFLAFIACFILIFIICCLWCSNTRRKQKERFERRNSIRMSKSSLAGSRSLVSVASTGFTDVNYRKRILSNSKDGNMVSTSPYGPGITPTATINPSSRNTGNNSYDSLADKPSLGLNSTADDEIQSYEIYEAQNNHRQPWPDPWKNSEPSREPSHVDNTTSSSEVESSNDGSATSASSHRDPYSAPTYASFRPQSRQKNQQPQPPQQPNDNSKSRHRIPSVPGYARPFAHSNAHENNLSVSTRLLDISQDSAVNNLRNSSIRSRSVGQILETNFDEVDDPPNTDDKLKHSMSMGDSALAHLTLSPLETEM